MRTVRALLVLAGVAAAGYGVHGLVRSTGRAGLASAARWLAGGTVVHDAVLAPAVLAVGYLVCRAVPALVRPYVQAGLVVTGSVLLVAAPVVSGRGYSPANPSALPFDYTRNLLVVLAAVWLGVLVVFVCHRIVRAAVRRRYDAYRAETASKVSVE